METNNSKFEIFSGSNCNGSKSLTIAVFGRELTIWGICEESDDLINQLDLATSISSSFEDVKNHLQLNGFDI